MGNWFLHSPVNLRTRRYCFFSNSDLGEVVSYEGEVVRYEGEVVNYEGEVAKNSKCLSW